MGQLNHTWGYLAGIVINSGHSSKGLIRFFLALLYTPSGAMSTQGAEMQYGHINISFYFPRRGCKWRVLRRNRRLLSPKARRYFRLGRGGFPGFS